MLLTCRWCGPREETECKHAGEGVPIPTDAHASAWLRALYCRSNPSGPFAENWIHVHGCRQWLNVIRDTNTHEIVSTRRLVGASTQDA